MGYKAYLIPYTTIISSTEAIPALEGVLNICELARSLTEKFVLWLIGKIQAIIAKLGLLKRTPPRTANNAEAAKQIPHIDKAFKLLSEATSYIRTGYMQFKLNPIRSSKTTALAHTAERIDQLSNAARGEIEIVYSVGNGQLYIAHGSFDDWIVLSQKWLREAQDLREKVISYYDKLIRNHEEIKTANSADINAFNDSVTNYVSLVTGLTQMIMSIQGG